MILPDNIRAAILVGKTERLRAELVNMIESGVDREELFGALEAFRAELRVTGNEPAEDATMNLMDFFVGFCGPHSRI